MVKSPHPDVNTAAPMRSLSKTRLLAFRQCPTRLWLEIHHPELREDSASTQTRFSVGNQVGDIARRLYDPQGRGTLIDLKAKGLEAAFVHTQSLLATSAQPVFEAGFQAEGALAFADVLLPVNNKTAKNRRGWRMVEVKSATTVHDYHRDDAAIQAYIARAAGLPLTAIALAHIDSQWVYPGNGHYAGLLKEVDLSDDAFGRKAEVREWIAQAQKVVAKRKAPKIDIGGQCSEPYECGFLPYCQSGIPQAENPVEWLPHRGKKIKTYIAENGITELRDVPDKLLNLTQQRVKAVTLSGRPFFDPSGAAAALATSRLPAYFMDFETIQFAVPLWKGTRPYQILPFQFSVHRLSRTSKLTHEAFLDLSGDDPSHAFAVALLAACGENENAPIFVYNASFEKSRIRELARRFPLLADNLLALNERVIDLLPIARAHYYHPDQHGSWSIKAVLPALCPDLDYADLDGVQNGGMAMDAFLEAIAPKTGAVRKAAIEQQLLEYCALDTYAMVRLWGAFMGKAVPMPVT
jgi:hypothetical protein